MSPGKTSSAVLLPGKLRNAAEFVEDVAKVIAKDAHSAEKLLDKFSTFGELILHVFHDIFYGLSYVCWKTRFKPAQE
ncbi:hypothetical protein Tco_1314998 [Tanacetum coccineum]